MISLYKAADVLLHAGREIRRVREGPVLFVETKAGTYVIWLSEDVHKMKLKQQNYWYADY